MAKRKRRQCDYRQCPGTGALWLRLETANSGRMQAQTAERSGAILQLEDAIYTKLPECADLMTPRFGKFAHRVSPMIAQRKMSVTAIPRPVFGLPVFLPAYMAHAGPEIDKRSGFLTQASPAQTISARRLICLFF